jgi:ankyrin repeat protein
MDNLIRTVKKVYDMETPRSEIHVRNFKKLVDNLVNQGMDQEQLNHLFRCHVGKLDLETTKWFVEEKGACVHPDSSLLGKRLNDYDSILEAESWSFQVVPLMDAILDLNVSKVDFLLSKGAKVIIYYSEDGGCYEESTLNLLCSTIHQIFKARRRKKNSDRDILLDIAKLLVRYHPSSAGICETRNIICGMEPMDCALGLQLDHSNPYWKACKVDYDILKLLLENGCSINGGSKWEEADLDFAPMHAALSQGDRELVEFIVNYEGFNPNQIFCTVSSNYVMHCFYENVDFSLLEILLERGADPMPAWRYLNSRNDKPNITVVTKFPNSHSLLKRLFRMLIRSDYDAESIMEYFENVSLEVFKRVSETGSVWIDTLDALQLLALLASDRSSCFDIMLWILDQRYDPNTLNDEGQTSLIEMISNMDVDSDAGPDMISLMKESLPLIVFKLVLLNEFRLAQKMPNPSLIMGRGTSPHDLQRRMKYLNLVDLSIKDAHGKSLRDYAIEKGLIKLIDALDGKIDIYIESC